MVQILLVLGTVVLILLSVFIVMLILLQRGSASGGLGTAFGGDAVTSAFGTETGNFLSKATIWGIVGFFVLTFSLYLGHMSRSGEQVRGGTLPGAELLVEPEAPAPEAVEPTPAETTPEPTETTPEPTPTP